MIEEKTEFSFVGVPEKNNEKLGTFSLKCNLVTLCTIG